ncbi:Thioesterase/thiol ester dehydrase-isomerase [Heliocybe sulcata]|uniref:Thioesterase/thiol ester dehydrase-isomerase n=1 Tax=Heliocybe sulcata TaxID=5364 RepID=A0A5C3NKR2_9AGAM|nr:Thioesterase/thiol ester dehydrase-isomerase [Heliocybe sulcata]
MSEGQAEHEQISTSLDVEQIDVNLFRSKSLWLPVRARGVFGGQVISQAVVSATKCVNSAFGLHSLHCYFLTSASPAVPILYYVERLREGRSYSTRSVKAAQNGKIVFIMLCSFQKPELWQPEHQWPMPEVPAPEECELEEDRLLRDANSADNEKVKNILLDYRDERIKSPVSIRTVTHEGRAVGNGATMYMYWMKTKSVPQYDAPYQKAILGYISDLYFIGVSANTLGLKRLSKGPDALGMMSTLDHSIYYYSDDFDCGDSLLYVITSPRTGSGRGVVHGRMYTPTGKLVAVMSQEGVVRADRQAPKENKAKL